MMSSPKTFINSILYESKLPRSDSDIAPNKRSLSEAEGASMTVHIAHDAITQTFSISSVEVDELEKQRK